MKEFNWPLVEMSDVDPEWWDEVMEGTSSYNEHFKKELTDAEDFTIRSIAHIILNSSSEDVAWYVEGSMQEHRIVAIHAMLHNQDTKVKEDGKEELLALIDQYTQAAIDRRSEE